MTLRPERGGTPGGYPGAETVGRWLEHAHGRHPLTLLGAGMCALRYILFRLAHPAVRVPFFYIGRGADFDIGPDAFVRIGQFVRFKQEFTGHFLGRVEIGDNVSFNRGCHVSAREEVRIWANCLFAEYVSIHDEQHIAGRGPEPIASRGYRTAPVVIGNNVWVGAKATILMGVTIGDNAVVGAHAVVTHDIPARSVAVGVPARVVRQV